jgi:heat shock protein HslJ
MIMIARSVTSVIALSVGALLAAPAAGAPPAPAQPPAAAESPLALVLRAHHWTLQSAVDAAGGRVEALLPPGRPFVMNFDGARLSIQGGCNRKIGGWRLAAPASLAIDRLASTQMACEPALMQADAALADALAQPLGVELVLGAAASLRLTTAAQQVLTFSGQPTLRSLHGEPRRIFLEVAPQTVPCKLPSGEPGRCLQVRELSFDDKGLRRGPPGPWRPFVGSIEGYTHTPGVRNVLRIDRYERRPGPPGGPAAVYVLDLVVQSETVAGK